MSRTFAVEGKGLGLRQALMRLLEDHQDDEIDFLEVAPENWIDVGGQLGRRFRRFTERTPFVCHGLSLNIGGPAPLDEPFIKRIRQFLDEHDVRCYSEHLSYCADDGHLYDLMPIPFTEEAIDYVAQRIARVQDILGRRLAVENVSYYCAPGQAMAEIEFINAVLQRADCELLLDVNNIYVNSVNHHYDAIAFLQGLPAERIAYAHVAGHFNEAEDLIVDTHGADVIDRVWDLLHAAYDHFGVIPTLLERDFNIPPLPELLGEVGHVGQLQLAVDNRSSAPAATHG